MSKGCINERVWRALSAGAEALSTAELAERTGLDRSRVGVAVCYFCRRGWARRASPPDTLATYQAVAGAAPAFRRSPDAAPPAPRPPVLPPLEETYRASIARLRRVRLPGAEDRARRDDTIRHLARLLGELEAGLPLTDTYRRTAA